MPLSTEAIPNSPLTGSEVMEYMIALVREYAVRYPGTPFKADLHFTMQNPAIPKYEVHAAVSQAADVTCPECHGHLPSDQTIICETCCNEFKVPNTPELALSNLLAEMRARMSTDWVFGANLTYPKIKYVITFSFLFGPERELSRRELSGEVANPNLVRVHYGLPIRQAEKVLPTEDNPMGGLRWGVLEFNRSDYPAPEAPAYRNLSPEVCGDVAVALGEDEDSGDDPEDDYTTEGERDEAEELHDSEDMGSEIAEYARAIGDLPADGVIVPAVTAVPVAAVVQKQRKKGRQKA